MHEKGLYNQAVEAYNEAAAAYLKAVRDCHEAGSAEGEAAARKGFDEACSASERLKSALGSMHAPAAVSTTQQQRRSPALAPAPASASTPARQSPSPSAASSASSGPGMADSLPGADRPQPPAQGNNGGAGASADGNYSKAELHVLRFTSSVNRRVFLPWVDADARERLGGSGEQAEGRGGRKRRRLWRRARAHVPSFMPAPFGAACRPLYRPGRPPQSCAQAAGCRRKMGPPVAV